MFNSSACTRALILAAALFGLVHPAAAQLRADVVATGLTGPLAIVPHPDLPGTLLVVEHAGLIKVVTNGAVSPTPFLDLTGIVTVGAEEGMLGLAFAPYDHSTVFVSFSNRRDPALPFPTFEFGDTVVARFRLKTGNPLEVDPATRFDLVWPASFGWLPPLPFLYQPHDVHKGGDLHFGPDGYLYIGFGEGGAFDDPIFNAQRPDHLMGKMVRIDVNVPATDPVGYKVPADNPFVNGQPIEALPEIWAFGYRNPWRWSFDDFGPGATNAMIVADVGQDNREEIDFEPAGRGGRNYGWYMREGSIATPNFPAAGPPAYLPLTAPMAEYPHGEFGSSITGGFVYRGSALPVTYQGRYFVGDYMSGRIFSVGLSVDGNGEGHAVDVLEHTGELGCPCPFTLSTFGRDLDGELYFTNMKTGTISKIVPNTAVGVPGAPVGFTGRVAGTSVSLSWQPGADGGPAVAYQIEAGTRPGAADLLVMPLSTPGLTLPVVPSGLYYVRVRAVNAAGAGAPSAELPIRVGCTVPAPAPSGLAAATSPGGFVQLAWTGTPDAASYLLDVGFTPGGTELGSLPLNGTTLSGAVPAGTYYARVRAVTACGTSAPSNEITVVVTP